jgi:hypothetical protein
MDAFFTGTSCELKAGVNDARNMQTLLFQEFGFSGDRIEVLVDTGDGTKPTGKTIKDKLAALVAASRPGDVLFFYFSGHGTQLADTNADESKYERKDEAIVPTDLNVITDDDLKAIFSWLPAGVSLTVVRCLHTACFVRKHEHCGSSEDLHKE